MHEIENDLGVVVVVRGITLKKVTDALPPLSRAGIFFSLLHFFWVSLLPNASHDSVAASRIMGITCWAGS